MGAKSTVEQLIDDITSMINLRDNVKNASVWIFSTIGVLYAWVNLVNIPAISIINSSDVKLILQIAIIVMYVSWSFGIALDISMSKIYIANPRRGHLPPLGYLNLIAMAIIWIILAYVRENVRYFIIAIVVFSVAWLLVLFFSRRWTEAIVDRSRDIYISRDEYANVISLERMARYQNGRWVWWRQIVLISMLIIILTINFVDPIGIYLRGTLVWFYPNLDHSAAANLIPLMSVLLFLPAAEGSQWLGRMSTFFSIRMLKSIGKQYKLIPL